MQERGGLPLVILEVGDKAVASADQVSQALDHFIGDVTRSSFAGAKKAGDTEGVNVICFCLFRKQLSIAIGLEGIEEDDLDLLPFEEGEEIFPEMTGGFQTGGQFFEVDLSFLKRRQQRFESFGGRIDRETGSHFFSLVIQEGQAVRLETDIDTEVKHGVPFFRLSSTHGVSSFSEIRIAWSILSGDPSEGPHSILNKCSRPQRRKATVFVEGSKRSQGARLVVSPPREESERISQRSKKSENSLPQLEKLFVCLTYNQRFSSSPYSGYPPVLH